MDWYSITVNITNQEVKDILTAEIFDLNCKGVEDLDASFFENEEQKSGISFFFESNVCAAPVIEKIKNIISAIPDSGVNTNKLHFDIEKIKKQNWREQWKENYKPIDAKEFLVLPSWMAETSTAKKKILIEPKMAFGTGTHETTRLMLSAISDTEIENKAIFDAGTGSGILAIACALKGARKIFANDIDTESIENTQENAKLNQVYDKIEVKLTDDSQYSKNEVYDILLANINRSVLIELLPGFYNITKNGGSIFLSGILTEEQHLIEEKVNELGMKVISIDYNNEWCAFRLKK